MIPLEPLARAADDIDTTDAPTPRQRLDVARALLASSALADISSPALGSIVLRPDQMDAARRAREHLRRDGGCLLADDVGTGKTYVALAVARDWASTLIVVPASLRSTWDDAVRRAGMRCTFITHEALSRGRLLGEHFDGIVVDESHRFRPTSRRHAVLAVLAARAPILMLSATPMQNRARELAAQLALFLGETAYGLEPARLTRWVVRSAAAHEIPLPRVRPPQWLTVDADDGAVLRGILALPPPPRAADAGDGGVLVQLSLVRAWASSRAALLAALRRRQRTLVAIEQCHREGRLPSRQELRSWDAGDDVQLGFPSLLASAVIDAERWAALARAIERERAALDALMEMVVASADPDAKRVESVRALRRAHVDESILAFSESRSTLRAYWRALRGEAGVGVLDAREAHIASGRLPRADLLARFAPRAQGACPPLPHARVTLLLTTDLLSEGVNLQDASVVVHLDLPWNPARLTQRLGRIRRPGGASEVASYLMSPPADAALLLRVEARLREKLARAERAIGRSVHVMPALGAPGLSPMRHALDRSSVGTARSALSFAEVRGEIARLLARWRWHGGDERALAHEQGVVVAVDADVRGWLALLDDGRLVASCHDGDLPTGPGDEPALILRALRLAAGTARRENQAERDAVRRAVDDWIARDWTNRSCGIDVADTPMRRRVHRALEAAVRVAPRHRRAAILERAAIVRRALARPLPLGVERNLDALADAGAARIGWIEEAVGVIDRAPTVVRDGVAAAPPRWRVLILFGSETTAR